MVNCNDFNKEKECVFKENLYSVRDNGAVLRHSRKNKRKRKYDDFWTFGNLNLKSGYLEIASVKIHRIVATAFHGEPSPERNIVDHKDTNKQNNRPSNLRWVSRLENILLNPITVKRIETACECSIEEFLADPQKHRHKFREQNFAWMGRVTEEQAKNCLENLMEWAKSDKVSKGGTLGEWIYTRGQNTEYAQREGTIKSLTINAVQSNWKIPSKFPYCPKKSSKDGISTYFNNLKPGRIFSENRIVKSIVVDWAISDDKSTLWVICNSEGPKPWSLAKVEIENDLFVHTNLGSYFKRDGAEKYFTMEQGQEWTKGDVFDDYC